MQRVAHTCNGSHTCNEIQIRIRITRVQRCVGRGGVGATFHLHYTRVTHVQRSSRRPSVDPRVRGKAVGDAVGDAVQLPMLRTDAVNSSLCSAHTLRTRRASKARSRCDEPLTRAVDAFLSFGRRGRSHRWRARPGAFRWRNNPESTWKKRAPAARTTGGRHSDRPVNWVIAHPSGTSQQGKAADPPVGARRDCGPCNTRVPWLTAERASGGTCSRRPAVTRAPRG